MWRGTRPSGGQGRWDAREAVSVPHSWFIFKNFATGGTYLSARYRYLGGVPSVKSVMSVICHYLLRAYARAYTCVRPLSSMVVVNW